MSLVVQGQFLSGAHNIPFPFSGSEQPDGPDLHTSDALSVPVKPALYCSAQVLNKINQIILLYSYLCSIEIHIACDQPCRSI